MSQVLEKPILLDETGQDIVEKLDDIKEAIGNSGEFIPLMIRVTTPPTKTTYISGETLDLTGLVVSLIATNGAQIDVTDQCTFVPANGTVLTSANTSVTVSYYYYKDNITFSTSFLIAIKSLVSISILTPPTKTDYIIGDQLDLTGIVVLATYNDGSTFDVTTRCTFDPSEGTTLSLSDTTVTATYVEGSTTRTATQAITVSTPVYGVEWDGSASSAFTRTNLSANFTDPVPQMSDGNGGWTTGSSPFDSILPWSGMVVETDSNNDVWVKIPKFYYKLDTSNGFKLQISNMPTEGFSVSPAHMDRGDGNGERDYVYIARYKAGYGGKSVTNTASRMNDTLSTWRGTVRGRGVEVADILIRITIQMLYLVEFADWNVQKCIGFGGRAWSSSDKTGETDSMTYHTGTTATSATTENTHVKYRNIEDLWSDGPEFCEGIIFDFTTSKFFICINPFQYTYDDDIITNGIDTGFSKRDKNNVVMSNANIKSVKKSTAEGLEWFFFPDEMQASAGSDYTTYITDAMNLDENTSRNDYRILAIGQLSGIYTGLFGYVTGSSSQTTARTMKLP